MARMKEKKLYQDWCHVTLVAIALIILMIATVGVNINERPKRSKDRATVAMVLIDRLGISS